MDIILIVVSKLCCAVCWEFMDVMRAVHNIFCIRGHHPTLFPLELPAYTSLQVLREMITCFEEILHSEIVTMMTSAECDRAPSRQSISKSSTGSQRDDNPDPDEGRDFFMDLVVDPANGWVSDEAGVEDEELDEDHG